MQCPRYFGAAVSSAHSQDAAARRYSLRAPCACSRGGSFPRWKGCMCRQGHPCFHCSHLRTCLQCCRNGTLTVAEIRIWNGRQKEVLHLQRRRGSRRWRRTSRAWTLTTCWASGRRVSTRQAAPASPPTPRACRRAAFEETYRLTAGLPWIPSPNNDGTRERVPVTRERPSPLLGRLRAHSARCLGFTGLLNSASCLPTQVGAQRGAGLSGEHADGGHRLWHHAPVGRQLVGAPLSTAPIRALRRRRRHSHHRQCHEPRDVV